MLDNNRMMVITARGSGNTIIRTRGVSYGKFLNNRGQIKSKTYPRGAKPMFSNEPKTVDQEETRAYVRQYNRKFNRDIGYM